MHIWTVANQKGGVGKTTTSIALGGLLAEAGQRVLLVDLDPQGSMTSYFGYDPDELEHSSFDLFSADQPMTVGRVRELLLPTSHDNLRLLPSSTALATLDRRNAGRSGLGLVILRALQQLQLDYQYALIDTPPQLGICMVNALAACERLLVPVQTEFLALKGLERMMHTLDMVGHSLRHGVRYLIVPTLFDRRTRVSEQVCAELRKLYPEHLWKSHIPVDTNLRRASKEALTPSQLDPSTRAVLAYKVLLGVIEPNYPFDMALPLGTRSHG